MKIIISFILFILMVPSVVVAQVKEGTYECVDEGYSGELVIKKLNKQYWFITISVTNNENRHL